MLNQPRRASRLILARGARAAEAAVVELVDGLAAEAAADPRLLALPVRVVVPSRSLRLHLAEALVRRGGRGLAGVLVQTHHAAAREVLERAGEPPPPARVVAELLARRLARAEPELAGPLDGLVDGYAAVAASVRDLVDAGLEPAHAEAADEALAGDGRAVASRAEVERARALVRTAARLTGLAAAVVEAAARELPAGGRSGNLPDSPGAPLARRAAELLAADPERALPARAVIVHGFADATGVVSDLLEALVRHRAATVVIDLPPDPAAGPVPRHPFAERLRARLEPAASAPPEEAAPPPAGALPPEIFEAAAVDPEAREVARRIRALLDAGARPEGIGVVVRDLAGYRAPLRRHLEALAVPFSGVGGRGSLTEAGRRGRALVDLLRRGPELPADRWLDSLAPAAGATPAAGPLRVDLRLAFRALGAGRLRDVAALDPDRVLRDGDSFALPLRQGLRAAEPRVEADGGGGAADAEADGDEGTDEAPAPRRAATGALAARRRVPGAALREAVAAARALLDRLGSWPERAPAGERFAGLRALLAGDLGWRLPAAGDEEPADPVGGAVAAAEAAVPPGFTLDRDELLLVVERALAGVGTDPVGGAGGGVQLLAVVEARGRTFDHLFLPGLNRGVFPRIVRTDPLLTDELRTVLGRLVPDVPIKHRGFDEERYLFAQLLAAAPRVVASWPRADAEGRPLAPSPLVERLAAAGAPVAPPAPPLWAAAGAFADAADPDGSPGSPKDAGGRAALRPAREHAVLAALHGPRQGLAPVLAAAIAEAGGGERRDGSPTPAAVAAARLAAVDELDPDLTTPEGRARDRRLGPFFGFVGPPARDDDPRHRPLYVTLLERLAGCPWQVFLERLLRIEPTPDPLQALPGVDPLLLGNLVHRVLERLVADAAPETASDLGTALAREPLPVGWPAEGIAELLAAEAALLVEREGIPLPGLARALEARARPFLEEARAADWPAAGSTVAVLGTEVEGALEIADPAGRQREMRFKADRVDAAETGPLLTDYKTGRPISEAKSEHIRRGHLLRDVKAGTRLQAAAYALAGSSGGAGATGRYLFLKPEIVAREAEVTAADREIADAFATAAAVTLAAWDAGVFFPRVVDPEGRREPMRCGWCQVAEACLRGDSGARRRIAGWAARHDGESADDGAGETAPEASPPDGARDALLGVWRLAARTTPERRGGRR